MTWGAIGAAAIGTVGGALLSSGSGGGGGATQTASKDPWSSAAPWLTHNLVRGEALQSYYQDNPFNAIQQAAYDNLLGTNDYLNQMAPGLLSQFSQSQGFDRNNPRARPAAIQFPAMQAGYQPTAGLLGASMSNPWAGALASYRSGIPGGAQPAPQQAAVGGMPAAVPPQFTGLIGAAPAPAAPQYYLPYGNNGDAS